MLRLVKVEIDSEKKLKSVCDECEVLLEKLTNIVDRNSKKIAELVEIERKKISDVIEKNGVSLKEQKKELYEELENKYKQQSDFWLVEELKVAKFIEESNRLKKESEIDESKFAITMMYEKSVKYINKEIENLKSIDKKIIFKIGERNYCKYSMIGKIIHRNDIEIFNKLSSTNYKLFDLTHFVIKEACLLPDNRLLTFEKTEDSILMMRIYTADAYLDFMKQNKITRNIDDDFRVTCDDTQFIYLLDRKSLKVSVFNFELEFVSECDMKSRYKDNMLDICFFKGYVYIYNGYKKIYKFFAGKNLQHNETFEFSSDCFWRIKDCENMVIINDTAFISSDWQLLSYKFMHSRRCDTCLSTSAKSFASLYSLYGFIQKTIHFICYDTDGHLIKEIFNEKLKNEKILLKNNNNMMVKLLRTKENVLMILKNSNQVFVF